jgi:cytochrome c oxidase subunit II
LSKKFHVGPLLSVTALQHAPLQYLTGSGAKVDAVLGLTWFVLLISIAVIVVIGGLLAGALWHRPGLAARPGEKPPLEEGVSGHAWLWIGVSISTLILLASAIWTMLVLARVAAPDVPPALTIEVTGRQWWWQARYLSDDPAQSFTTANEIHIPAGVPVRFRLIGGDVIHSFWVPQLAGKTDVIPGQINETWFEAHAPGTFSGQCTEYCGVQHAHMSLVVIAQAPADFAHWRAHQLALPRPNLAETPGAMEFVAHCGGCHTVRGTAAGGTLGPDLSHLMQRTTIASGSLPNDGPNLRHWISDPQSVKPGSFMPAQRLSAYELADVQTYLDQLQ